MPQMIVYFLIEAHVPLSVVLYELNIHLHIHIFIYLDKYFYLNNLSDPNNSQENMFLETKTILLSTQNKKEEEEELLSMKKVNSRLF